MINQIADYLNSHGLKIKMLHQRQGPKCMLAELVWLDEPQNRELEKIIPQMMQELKCKSIITEAIPETENLLMEIPLDQEQSLDFSRLTASEAFKNARGALPICLGTDADGVPQISDLYQLRHLLLLGKNGCGKTSTLQSVVLSLTLKKNKDEIKFALFNAKGEFDIYDQQSYLLTPVIKEYKQAREFLAWLCEETERRRLLFQKSGSHHIRDYHNHVGTLPYIVVVLDEFYDLTEQEPLAANYMNLLLQKGGACGIFLVMSATDPNYEKISFLQRSDFLSVLIYQSQPSDFLKTFINSENPSFLQPQADAWLNVCKSSLKRIHTCRMSTKYIKQILEPYQKEIFSLPLENYDEKAIPKDTSSIWKNFLNWWK